MRETRLERAALGVTVGIVCLSLALHARPAAAWTASFPDGAASTVGVDRHGDVVVGGTVRSTTAPEQFDGVVVELSAAGGAEAWRWTVSGGAIERLVVDAAGDVIAAGGLRADGAVVKLSGVSGTEVWRYVLPGAVFHAVAIDASGDVVAAGALRLPPRVPTFAFVVVRLDGINGAERWRRELPTSEEGAMDAAFAVGLDSSGDVFACGDAMSAPQRPSAFTALKLGGHIGEVRWQQALRGSGSSNDGCNALAVDGSGDVVACGRTVNENTENDFTVAKLDGKSGHEVWRQIVVGSTTRQRARARVIALFPNGDVAAAGSISNRRTGVDFAVVNLSGADGTPRWRRTFHGRARESLRDPPFPGEGAWGLALDTRGDVVTAGLLRNAPESSLAVAKLAQATGRVRWRRVIGGGGGARIGVARAVTVAPSGDVVAAGLIGSLAFPDLFVIQLDGTSGASTPATRP
jgi:hypothetical protein